MKRLALLLCAAALFQTQAFEARAQTAVGAQAQTNSKPDDNDSTKVASTFDAGKNETTVEFKFLPVANTATEKVILSVSSSYKGKQKPGKPPEDVILILSIVSTKSGRFPDMMAMDVTADGKKLSQVLILDLDKRRLTGQDEYDYLDTLGTRMKYDVFKKLMNAKSVTLGLPGLTLQLGETHAARMRELDALIHS